MEKLKDSLVILSLLMNDIVLRNDIIIEQQLHFKAAKISPEPKDTVHFLTMFRMTIIQTQAYLDEYERHFGVTTEPVFKKKIVALKECLKPAHAQFKKWSDFNKLRNEFSAHNMRSKGDFIFSQKTISLNAPRNFYDLLLIGNLLTIMTNAIQLEFPDFLAKELHAVTKVSNPKPNQTKDSASSITLQIVLAINKLLKENGRNYSVNLRVHSKWDIV